MQLCGSAHLQGSSHDFAPHSQPGAVCTPPFYGVAACDRIHHLLRQWVSVCQGRAWYIHTTVGCCLLFAAFHVCAGSLLLLMRLLVQRWLSEELRLPLIAWDMWRSSHRNIALCGVSWHKWQGWTSQGETSSSLGLSSRKTMSPVSIPRWLPSLKLWDEGVPFHALPAVFSECRMGADKSRQICNMGLWRLSSCADHHYPLDERRDKAIPKAGWSRGVFWEASPFLS